jgi:CRISPR-associated protein Cas1
MLNEFVYCPRLFYYEFVEGVFVQSADTLRGGAIHQRVDAGNGALPAAKRKSTANKPAETRGDGPATAADSSSATNAAERQTAEPEIIHSRSVQMGSERLAVVAKMDLVEVLTEKLPPPSAPTNDSTIPRAGERTDVGPVPPPGVPSTDPSWPHLVRVRLTESVPPPGVPANDSTLDLAADRAVPEAGAPADSFAALEVCPVDYKAGAPKEGEDANELWDTDKMQLGLQALILRDNGYACHEGIIYYRATKQRVRLPITADLERWILQQIAEARRIATGPMPPPLVHSPKCVRCSLAPVCLPDETRMLSGPEYPVAAALESAADQVVETRLLSGPPRQQLDPHPSTDRYQLNTPKPTEPPRRLMAARDDTRPLYLNTQGYRVGCKDDVLQVKEADRVVDEARLRDLSHVALFGNIQISTQAIQALCEMEIPITYFSLGGWFYGLTRGHTLKNVFLRMEQFRLASDPPTCLSLARRMVHGKIRNHRTLLMRNHVEPPDPAVLKLKRASEDALAATSLGELLGIEGAAASQYFQHFSGMVKVEEDLPGLELPRQADPQFAFNFNFTHRNRRPPMDPVNAMLSLAYSLLSKDCLLAALAVGFDPYLGFYHQPRFGRPALALDLMEEMRPLIAESTVLSCLNNRVITEKDFVRAGQAVNLTAPGRKRFFQMYEQRMSSLITHPLFDYKVSYRRALELQARLLAKALTGEIAEYLPLLTR